MSHTPDGEMSPDKQALNESTGLPGVGQAGLGLGSILKEMVFMGNLTGKESIATSKKREGGPQTNAQGDPSVAHILAEEEISG